MTHQLFHPVIAGVMIAAVMSAIMSTADSQLLVAASRVAHDLPVRSRVGTLRGSRWVVLLLSGVAIITSLVGTTDSISTIRDLPEPSRSGKVGLLGAWSWYSFQYW